MYTVGEYGAMIADEARTGAFARALARAIAPGATVLDIGTGTGMFALLACRLGAGRVYAVEPADAIEVAREIAAANGVADRITFIQAHSTTVALPERVDVIVSDLAGSLPWFGDHITSIVDARCRLLAPGGTLVPRRDTAWAAVVELPDLYERHTRPWNGALHGFDMTAARRIVVNTCARARVAGPQLLTEVQRWGAVDYATVEDPDARGELSWIAHRSGIAHGLAAGFDRILADGIEISNAPDTPDATRHEVYGAVFFPWPQAVPIEAGDRILATIEGHFVRGNYVWQWTSRIEGVDGHAVKAEYSQSTFFGSPVSLASLRRASAAHVPQLSDDGRVAQLVLTLMGQATPLGDIARAVREAFPARFGRFEDALACVTDLSRRYSTLSPFG